METRSYHCPLCGNPKTTFTFKKGIQFYFDCKPCDFRFSISKNNANFPDDFQDFGIAYREYFQNLATAGKNYRPVFDFFEGRKNENLNPWLDVGCGSGNLVRMARSSGFEAVGIEESKVLFKEYLSTEPWFLNARLNDYSKSHAGKFKIITLIDVLEHIPDPVTFLQSIWSLLAPGGIFILHLPVRKSWVERILNSRWPHYNRFHFSFFSENGLKKLMQKTGFKILQAEIKGKYYNLGYLLLYFREFVFGVKGKPGKIKGPDLYLNPGDLLWLMTEKTTPFPSSF